MNRQDATDPYLGTWEGAAALIVTTALSILSFMTLIDREPSGITRGQGEQSILALLFPHTDEPRLACDVGSPSQGMYVVPNDACFPLDTVAESLFPIYLTGVLIPLGCALASRYELGHRIISWIESNWLISIPAFAVTYALLGLLDIALLPELGIDRTPQDTLIPNITYALIFTLHAVIVALPFWVYTHSLLPKWIENRYLGRRTRENLQYFIDANWRRARILTTLSLTGAVGIALSFVFSRASPNFLFVVAIVGSVTIGPLGVVWFPMRRIREAEKELRPTR